VKEQRDRDTGRARRKALKNRGGGNVQMSDTRSADANVAGVDRLRFAAGGLVLDPAKSVTS